MWTEQQIRDAIIKLPPSVQTRAQAFEFLGLAELDDVDKPYIVMAIITTYIPDFPFAVLVNFPRESIRKNGWPMFFDSDRIWSRRPHYVDVCPPYESLY